MSPKVNTTLLSAAVISGLLVSAAPAQATETTDASVQSITVEQPETQTAPAVPATPVVPVAQPAVETVVETAPPVVEAPAGIVEDVAAEAPAEQAVVQEPQAPAEDSAEEIAPAAPLEETATTEPVEESTVVQDPATGTETDATQPEDETSAATEETAEIGDSEGTERDNAPLASFLESAAVQQLSDEFGDLDSDMSDEEQAFWEKVDALLPEGSEDWDDAQWDAYYETEDGQLLLQLIEEEFGAEDPEMSDEDLQFLEEMMNRLPAGAEDWTDAQWGEFFATEDGQEYLVFVLTYLLDGVTSEAELEELLESIWAEFPGDEQWLEDFLAFYFGEDGTEPEGEKPEVKPEAKPEAKPSEKPVEIKPAGTVDKKPENTGSEAAKGDAKPQASENELAETGFSGALLAAAGAGLLLMLAGAAMVLRRRKA